MINKQEQVLVILTSINEKDHSAYWDEFIELIHAANMHIKIKIIQKMKTINSATYIGSGKVIEIQHQIKEQEIDLVVIDHVLSPLQSRNLEKAFGCPIMDRNALILEIFETRAVSAEAKLQIEAAQLNALLPKLVGSTSYLGRQSGGRNKGAGEKKLELDRRVIKRRISEVRKELKQLEKQRKIRAVKRRQINIPTVALIGYTNVGKSTLMNQLLKRFQKKEQKQVLQKDMLFATLDTSVRRIELDANRQFLLIDTVGFVSNLPHELIEAFHSTLEQIKEADLLIQVIDGSNPYYDEQIQVTQDTLQSLEVEHVPMLYLYNKADLLGKKHPIALNENSIQVSLTCDEDIDFLCDTISKHLFPMYETWKLKIPYESDAISQLRKQAVIRHISYEDEAMIVEVDLDHKRIIEWKDYLLTK